MAAMIWDEQSQAFVETTNTPMRYDAESGAWVETTGMAWDEQSQAWTERWGQKVSAYVYGAALETVTIKKNGIIVATVDTDSSGQSTEQISLSCGIYTLTGSVSGWTEEQTVSEDTTEFRAMPEGAIYWYGNKCELITGGWAYASYARRENYAATSTPDVLNWNTNSILFGFKNKSAAGGGVKTQNEIDISSYSKINAIWGTGSYYTGPNDSTKYYGRNANCIGLGRGTSGITNDLNYWYSAMNDGGYSVTTTPTVNRMNVNIRTPSNSYYFAIMQSISQSGTTDYVTEVCAIWLS